MYFSNLFGYSPSVELKSVLLPVRRRNLQKSAADYLQRPSLSGHFIEKVWCVLIFYEVGGSKADESPDDNC